MTKKITLGLLVAFLLGAAVSVTYWRNSEDVTTEKTRLSYSTEEVLSKHQLNKRKHSYINPMGFPAKFHKMAVQVRTGPNETQPSYPANYRTAELQKLRAISKKARPEGTQDITWTERGPVNVPGRTRAILVDPSDATGNTWFAGAASGGVWKTTNAGANWRELTSDMVNLAISSIVMSAANTDVIYAGTGEGFLPSGNPLVNGGGIFKSTDKGETWVQLTSTVNEGFGNVTRLIIDPNDENILVATTASSNQEGYSAYTSGIYRSIDGGQTWTKTYSSSVNESQYRDYIQTIVSTPNNFAVQYAGVNSKGIIKSEDGGQTWTNLTPLGTFPLTFRRVELAIANTDTNIIYAALEGGTYSALYLSKDAGATWVLVNDTASDGAPADWFSSGGAGNQGWYDNTIVVHPYNDFIVYVGGIHLWRFDIGEGVSFQSGVLSVTEGQKDFLGLFGPVADWEVYGGKIDGSSTLDESKFVSIELRFGPDKKQFAHRFEVPETGGTNSNGGAGVSAIQYSYKDYVEVPFELWDVTNNKQLMISFRDQSRDGGFTLNFEDPADLTERLEHREYIYMHAIDYDTEPSSRITKNGGQEVDYMYNIWPIYTGVGETWDPTTVTEDVSLSIVYGERIIQNGGATIATESQGQRFGGSKNNNVHPDQHFLTIIPSGDGETFRILNGNDGGVYLSKEGKKPATKNDNWTKVGIGYNTAQFYGADKQPGEDVYVGGTQDNGSWASIGTGGNTTASSEYEFVQGGDGFEALWHATDPKKAITSTYNNRFSRTLNAFRSSFAATNGFNDEGPFISRLANSPLDPDLIHTYGSSGPWYSTNFAGSWRSSTIDNETWLYSQYFSDIESSLADADIVWIGGAMGKYTAFPAEEKTYHVHVSTNGGRSYTATSDFGDMGVTSSVATHPFDSETAYVMFGVHNNPKILRTTDLGQTWEDISGFAGSSTGSTNGFPDVVVTSLLVLPHEPNTIWAGTDIGMVESNDNGVSWHMLDTPLPAVAIHTMKVVDDQVVIGTHGRGIWTATIPELLDVTGPENILKPIIVSLEQVGSELKIGGVFNLRSPYDDVDVVVDGTVKATLPANSVAGEVNSEIEVADFGIYKVQLKAHKGGEEYVSEIVEVEIIEVVEGLNDPEIARSVSVFPNPTNGEVNLRIENVLDGDLKVSVYNTAGQRVFTKQVHKDSNVFEMPIDFSQMAAGSYVVELINGTERITKKVIRTK